MAIVLLHGFTQNARCWGPVAADLERDHDVLPLDAPGHGSATDVECSFEDGAARLAGAGGAGTYVGYSMGGRYALRIAVDRPVLVERLVLIGASPGLADPAERVARRAADAALADRIEAIGVPAFVDEWLDLPLFAGLHPAMASLDERLTNTASGLASSLRTAGTGAQEPLWDRLAELSMPVLLVVGSEDAKFTAIAEKMAVGIGSNATVVSIPQAGHTAHLEQPETFLTALRTWLEA